MANFCCHERNEQVQQTNVPADLQTLLEIAPLMKTRGNVCNRSETKAKPWRRHRRAQRRRRRSESTRAPSRFGPPDSHPCFSPSALCPTSYRSPPPRPLPFPSVPALFGGLAPAAHCLSLSLPQVASAPIRHSR
jgi:hypothetical protein